MIQKQISVIILAKGFCIESCQNEYQYGSEAKVLAQHADEVYKVHK